MKSGHRFLRPRHFVAYILLLAMLTAVALGSELFNISLGIRSIGVTPSRVVGAGEIATVALGTIGSCLGVSELASWERTASRRFGLGYAAWATAVVLSAPIPLLVAPLGALRNASPGLSEVEWIPYAYGEIVPFALWASTFVALSLMLVVLLGRVLGAASTIALFFVSAALQSQFAAHLTGFPIPGTPVPDDISKSSLSILPLALVAIVFSLAAVFAWFGGGSKQPILGYTRHYLSFLRAP
mgnify:CR=1 FL=1